VEAIMYISVDSDSHLVEPEAVWTEYTPAAWRELVPQIVHLDGIALMKVEGQVFEGFPIAAATIPGGLGDLERTAHTPWSETPRGGRDPKARLGVLDEEGLDATMLYPSIGLTFAAIRDPKVAAIASEAYNNWVADFCSINPKRLHAVATVPLQDVAMAVQELRRARKLGLRAATIRPTPYSHRRLNDPAYDLFWAAAEELAMPVAIHGSFAVGSIQSVVQDRYPNHDLFFSHVICHPLEQQMASMDMLCGGVLERFPKLRVSFLEAGAGWMLYWLDRLDGHFEKLGRFIPWQKTRPSELFMRNCFVAFDPEETSLKYLVDRGFEETLLWGADYPHYDCAYPRALAELREKLAEVPARVGEKILARNPARFYGVDFAG
jgi:predicted TIM-barrel fold metal-dependent hydrolase